MAKKPFLQLQAFVFIFILIFTAISCGRGPSSSSKNLPGQLIVNISQAKTDAERQAAIKSVICQSLSLGYIDEKGIQLNHNVGQESVSLTADDLAAMSYFISEAQGYTISDIIDFIAAAGFLLSSTKQIITTKDVLPDLQKYVDWSYAHRDDPRSLLGLVLSSGPNIQVVGAPPIFQGDTRISNTAGLMMLADILVGVPKDQKVSANLFGNVAYAADSDLQELAVEIQGLIVAVETGPEFKELYARWVETALGNKSTTTATPEPTKLKVPDVVKNLVNAFATGSRFAVRLIETHNPAGNIVKSVDLPKNSDESYPMSAVLVVVPSGQLVTGVPITYTMNLINEYTGYSGQGGLLFPDADAVLESAVKGSSTEFDGHRLGIMPSDGIGKFYVMTNYCSNLEPRAALLHASAQINAPDFDLLTKQYADKLELVMGITNKSLADLKAMYSVLQRSMKVTPWMCTIIIPPADLKIFPDKLTGELNKQYTFIVQAGRLLEGYRYEWTIERETASSEIPYKEVQYENKGELNYTFPKDGGYKITLKITNNSSQVYAEASAQAAIGLMPNPVVSLDIETPTSLETLQSYNFKAIPSVPVAQLPPDTAYKWDFGDGDEPIITTYSTERFLITPHIYKKNGDYTVKLSLIDKTTKHELAVTTKKMTVSDLISLRKTNHIIVSLSLYGLTEGNGAGLGPTTKNFGSQYYSTPPYTFEWVTANTFKCTYKNIATTTKGVQTTISEATGTISVSADGVKLTSYIYKENFSNPNYEGSGNEWKYSYRVELRNIPVPLTKMSGGDNPKYYYRVQGKDVEQYVTESIYENHSSNGQDTFFYRATWDNFPSGFLPQLEITLDFLK